jgi:sulfopyruvate decarboxylase alpha subunit
MSEWSGTMIKAFTGQGIRFVTYVPDKVLIPLIDGFQAHSKVTAFSATREEEAVGIAAGASLGGAPSAVLMQSSGFGNIPNALASLLVPYQLPVVLVISERGVLGEFNAVQVPISRVIRPALDALGIPHVTLEREDEVEFLVTRSIHQCHRTQQPAALILSPRLTGGKMEG